MVWTIAILFIIAIGLLLVSFIKSSQSAKTLEQQIDQVSFTFKDEIYQLQQQIKNMELDIEMTAKEAGIATDSPDRVLLREALSLFKRGYSVDTIAQRQQQPKEDIERLLAPFVKLKNEGSEDAREN